MSRTYHARPARSRAVRKGRQEERLSAVLDIVHRRELFLAVTAAVARRNEDHPGRSDGRHVLASIGPAGMRSEEHTSELQSLAYLVCRLLLEKKKERTLGFERY